MIHSRVNVLFILWQLLQTPALGASTNLLRNCLLLTTSKKHSVEVHMGGKARHLTPRLCHQPHWIVLCVSIPVLMLMLCWVILLRMTIPRRSLSGKPGMRMCSKRLKVGSATCWLSLLSHMAAPSWLITGSVQPPPARRPRWKVLRMVSHTKLRRNFWFCWLRLCSNIPLTFVNCKVLC